MLLLLLQKGTFLGKHMHSNTIFTQITKFIYVDTSAAPTELLMSDQDVLLANKQAKSPSHLFMWISIKTYFMVFRLP
jgi:hypothetical protein